MDDKKFPKIKKSIEDFIYEEEGNIPRNKVVALGTMILVMSLLMYDEVFAGHRSHSSHRSHSLHSSGSGGGHSSHESHVSHSSHVSGFGSTGSSGGGTSSTTPAHGSHSNHSNHASHSNVSHYNVAKSAAGTHANTTVTTQVPDISVEDVSGIQVPNSNALNSLGKAVDVAISVPEKTLELGK